MAPLCTTAQSRSGFQSSRRSFFFSSRRRHTRYWRDWSSDVCSSDLRLLIERDHSHGPAPVRLRELSCQPVHRAPEISLRLLPGYPGAKPSEYTEVAVLEIGRASCRERV